jgi:hypothetical protein
MYVRRGDTPIVWKIYFPLPARPDRRLGGSSAANPSTQKRPSRHSLVGLSGCYSNLAGTLSELL